MSSVVDDNWMNKCTLICKPEQSGKTFVMISQIVIDMNEPIPGTKTVNIILCDNNLLLTKQTSERVKNDLGMFCGGNGEIYLEFSSHKRTNYHTAVAVTGALVTEPVRNVLCCTNGVRVDDIYDIIDKLSHEGLRDLNGDKFAFKVWLDEADKATGFIDETFKSLLERPNVQLYCITATPKELFRKYGAMNVFPIEKTTTDEYHGWNDNQITLIDESVSTGPAFVEHVLNSRKELITPGSKWFIPASYTKASHNEVKDFCVKLGFAVLVVNGDGLQLTLPYTKELIMYKKDDELNVKIKEMYTKHSLSSFPFAITGNTCISRGISIMSEDFVLDYGILSTCNNQQEASQNSGRLKGNIKGWRTYKPPKVFTTAKFNAVAQEWESKSRGLAEMAHRMDQDGEGTFITKNQFNTLDEDYDYIVEPEEFKSFAKAKAFLKTKNRSMRTKGDKGTGSPIHPTSGGYKVSSKLLRLADIKDEDRITRADLVRIAAGRCISSTDKGSRYLIVPFYETLDTPPNQEKYQVRYIHFK
jgi:hypothetical protein